MVRGRYDDDDDGQVEGDGSPPGDPFAKSMTAQPWLRSGMPPWHMWGNTILVPNVPFQNEVALPPMATGQLIKVAYKRPDTFHWVLAARIINAPAAPIGLAVGLDIHFDLIIGLGRAQITLPDFEFFRWTWQNRPAPTDIKYSTNVRTPPLVEVFPPPVVIADDTRRLIDQITAQDIQLSCRLLGDKDDGEINLATVEVSAFFSPKNHFRPDWFLQEPFPLESTFPGDEIGGR